MTISQIEIIINIVLKGISEKTNKNNTNKKEDNDKFI